MSEFSHKEALEWFKQTYSNVDGLYDLILERFLGTKDAEERSDDFTREAALIVEDLYEQLSEELEEEYEYVLESIRSDGEWISVDELDEFDQLMDTAVETAFEFLTEKTVEALKKLPPEEFVDTYITRSPDGSYKLDWKSLESLMLDVIKEYGDEALGKGKEAGLAKHKSDIQRALERIYDEIYETNIEDEDEDEWDEDDEW